MELQKGLGCSPRRKGVILESWSLVGITGALPVPPSELKATTEKQVSPYKQGASKTWGTSLGGRQDWVMMGAKLNLG